MSGLDDERTRRTAGAAARRLVTVASYPSPIEAHLARARLEAEGLSNIGARIGISLHDHLVFQFAEFGRDHPQQLNGLRF